MRLHGSLHNRAIDRLEAMGLKLALEIIDKVVWWVGNNGSIQLGKLKVIGISLRHGNCLSQLPIGLTVHLVSFDEHRAIRLFSV